ncbi:6620_t:CDS:1 [Funneliformis geosporum]|uniref:6620_t:CDS:1 n=1 Tax=Funneliformis geosporum TaxID=1117311 RepID=A0A9W4WNA2_9GLOM|nr:6620_t:CDS:1 [Funneliformis geosporum]
MEPIKFLTEIVLKVVEFLADDIASLHSCILVNREWCKITIPILWSDTFKQIKPYNNVHSPEENQIISTYITELSDRSIVSLNGCGVRLPTQQKLLFEYSKFLRHLDMYRLKLFVRSWLYFTTRDSIRRYTSDQIQKMSIVLLNHFLRQTPYLISLKFTSSDTTEPIISALQDIPEARSCLSKLKSLKQYYCTHPAKATLFSQLAKYSLNIEHLDIAIDSQISELLTLIFAQRNLKRLSIRYKGAILSNVEPWANGETVPVMPQREILITHLKLENVNFPLLALYKFENLIELELKSCGYQGYSKDDLIHFSNASFKLLEIFSFESKYPIYLEYFAGLISSSGENLRSLTLHGCQIEDPENAQKLLVSLANYSPNIIFYDGPILEDNICDLEAMLDKCNKLETLFLHPSIPRCFAPTPSINFDPLFNVITRNKSHKLRWLAIIHAWKISEKALLDFFETHKKKNVGPIKFNYERSCTVFYGISTICTNYNYMGVGRDCKLIYCSKHHL